MASTSPAEKCNLKNSGGAPDVDALLALGGGTMATCICAPGANDWIHVVFGLCAYNEREVLSFLIGLVSISFWVVTQLPQMITNYRKKKADGLSGWLLLNWTLGDLCNYIGCIVTGDQLPTETYTALYFLLSDFLLSLQYTYYRAQSKRRRSIRKHFAAAQRGLARHEGSKGIRTREGNFELRGGGEEEEGGAARGMRGTNPIVIAAGATVASLGVVSTQVLVGGRVPVVVSASTLARRSLLSAAECGSHPPRDMRVYWVGQGFGYVSVAFYIFSRLAQIRRNYLRRSVDGLSMVMFVFAVLANLTYAASIFIDLRDTAELVNRLPWILGSLGTVLLDLTIFGQSFLYKDSPVPSSTSSTPAFHATAPPIPIKGGSSKGKETTPLLATSRSVSQESIGYMVAQSPMMSIGSNLSRSESWNTLQRTPESGPETPPTPPSD